METIAAIATALSPAGIAIIRMSGDKSVQIASKLFDKPLEEPRKLYLGTFSKDGFAEKCLCVRFKEPHSFTGEDVIEFQVHGGVTLAREILNACIQSGARMAEPGEFSKRAFLNGKMTLTQAEGTIDTIQATSDAELRAAYRLVSGGLSATIESMRLKIIDTISSVEVVLDYPEEDLEAPHDFYDTVQQALRQADRLLATRKAGMIVKDGLQIALLGKPNVGKSSLLNALLGVERAIVTPVAGTTRDHISESLLYRGVKFNFIDTAGLRESTDEAEAAGIRHSRKIADGCDVAILLVDGTRDETDEQILNSINAPKLIVANKADLSKPQPPYDLAVSAKTGEGIEQIKEKLYHLYLDEGVIADGEILTNERHYAALVAAKSALQRASEAPALHLAVVDLRDAVAELGKIDGSTVSEDVTNSIFAKFCLGK